MLAKGHLITIGQLAELIDSTPEQIRRWERESLIPPPATRVKRGIRSDRRYTAKEAAEIKELRRLYHVGAPTIDEQYARQKRQERFKRQENHGE